MKVLTAFLAMLLVLPGAARAQDVLKTGAKHVTVLAEDDRVRVLRGAPHPGDRTPMHSHPASVSYVVKGCRVRFTFPDGTAKDAVIKTGEATLRPPVTHADEALDDCETILVELKK